MLQLFSDLNCSGFGATNQNEKGEVMVAMSAKGPPVGDSEEAEILVAEKFWSLLLMQAFRVGY